MLQDLTTTASLHYRRIANDTGNRPSRARPARSMYASLFELVVEEEPLSEVPLAADPADPGADEAPDVREANAPDAAPAAALDAELPVDADIPDAETLDADEPPGKMTGLPETDAAPLADDADTAGALPEAADAASIPALPEAADDDDDDVDDEGVIDEELATVPCSTWKLPDCARIPV